MLLSVFICITRMFLSTKTPHAPHIHASSSADSFSVPIHTHANIPSLHLGQFILSSPILLPTPYFVSACRSTAPNCNIQQNKSKIPPVHMLHTIPLTAAPMVYQSQMTCRTPHINIRSFKSPIQLKRRLPTCMQSKQCKLTLLQ